jgi:hypothetical protein
MLPDFLIPYARMRLDRVLEAAREKERGADLERCSQIIGCIDLETVRRHLTRLEKASAFVALELAEGHAAKPHLIEHNLELGPLCSPPGEISATCPKQFPQLDRSNFSL